LTAKSASSKGWRRLKSLGPGFRLQEGVIQHLKPCRAIMGIGLTFIGFTNCSICFRIPSSASC
jgi:hypothetical protein